MRTTTTTTKPTANLDQWERLLRRIKNWETTSTKKTISEMWEDLHRIQSGCDVIDDNDGFLRASECIHFMRAHFHNISK